ncbi:MAG: tetratricopeptide repeat protein [Ktedonobacteraceae bacterium]|nr:tetratricopeptide repeat protein [Ktedonobacteraceae bacterium]
MPVKKAAQAQPNVLLRRARLERGWSQQEVADLVGASQAFMVNRWENGTAFPGPGYRKKLCEIFDKSRGELGLIKADSQRLVPELPLPVFDPLIPLRISATSSLIGRVELLECLQQQLSQPGERVQIALYGLPGVGKTTLAVELAASVPMREAFRDGVLWAGLGPRPHLPSLLSRWANLLGISQEVRSTLESVDDWVQVLRQAIGDRHMLIVIDDAWSVEAALSCMVGGIHCCYVLTTRIPAVAVHFAGTQVVRVPELSLEEGVRLLRLQAPALEEVSGEVVRRLVEAVGGLPLALKLMGTYLLMQTRTLQQRRLKEALDRLQKAEERLHLEQPQAGPDRDQRLPEGTPLTLQVMIGLSEAMLSEGERQALYSLAVFPPRPESFSEEAALVVAGIEVQVLDRLVDVGLAEYEGQGRYMLHQTIADFARAQWEDRRAEGRLVEYVLDYVERYQEDYDVLAIESGVIFSALEIAPQVEKEAEFVRIVCAVVAFLRRRGLFQLLERYLRQAYQIAQAQRDYRHLMRILDFLSEILRLRGVYDEAQSRCLEGLALARQYHNQARCADLLARLGRVEMDRGEYERAKGHFQEALQIAQDIGYAYRMAGASACLADVLAVQGDFTLAESLMQQGIELSYQYKYQDQALSQIARLGWIQKNLGKFIEAETVLRTGLEQAEALGSRAFTAGILTMLGWVLMEQEDSVQAEHYLQQAVDLARRVWLPGQLAEALALMGMIEVRRGEPDRARAVLREGLELARAGGQREKLSFLLMVQGQAEAELDNGGVAEAALLEGLELTRQIGHCVYGSGILKVLGTVYMKQGRREEALVRAQECLEMARQARAPWYIGEGLYVLGRWYLACGEYEAAMASFEEIRTTVPPAYRGLVSSAHEGLARVAAARGRAAEARRLALEALHNLEGMGSSRARALRSWLTTLPAG